MLPFLFGLFSTHLSIALAFCYSFSNLNYFCSSLSCFRWVNTINYLPSIVKGILSILSGIFKNRTKERDDNFQTCSKNLSSIIVNWTSGYEMATPRNSGSVNGTAIAEFSFYLWGKLPSNLVKMTTYITQEGNTTGNP